MDIAAAISRAAMPDPHTVCGVVLRPYCIGHWRLLNRCNISFITDAEHHALGDLLLGVLICSGTHEDFTGSLNTGGVKRVVSRWRYRLAGGFFGVWKRRRDRLCGKAVYPEEILGFDFPAECKKFQSYLDEHGGSGDVVNDWSRPQTMFDRESFGKACNAPEMEVIFDALVSELKLTEGEALNIGLPLARWRLATHAERMGWVTIVTDEMRNDKQTLDETLAGVDRAGVEALFNL